MRKRNQGLSLIELMVAVSLGLVTVIVVMQVLSVYEARKRTTTVGNDAEIGAAVGLFMVEREVRMAGAGLTMPAGLACGSGMNLQYNGTAIADGQPVAPLLIIDGGAGPDRIRVLRSNANFGVAPATVVKFMASEDAEVTVSRHRRPHERGPAARRRPGWRQDLHADAADRRPGDGRQRV